MRYPMTILDGGTVLHFLAHNEENEEIWKDKLVGMYYTYDTTTKMWVNKSIGVPLFGYTDTYHKGLE